MKCEHCERETSSCGNLTAVNFWEFPERLQGKKIPSYLYVCDDCLQSKGEWCENLFPDLCDLCGGKIEPGDHIIDYRDEQERIGLGGEGLGADERRDIICESCYDEKGNADK